ncbi:hypothetical protein V6N13_021410 [Hibiscus sabdariffa]
MSAKCANCSRCFSNKEKVKDHSKAVHKKFKYSCSDCGNAFENARSLEQHQNEQHSHQRRHRKMPRSNNVTK